MFPTSEHHCLLASTVLDNYLTGMCVNISGVAGSQLATSRSLFHYPNQSHFNIEHCKTATNRVLAILSDKFVNYYVIWLQLRSSVIPPDNLLTSWSKIAQNSDNFVQKQKHFGFSETAASVNISS